MLSRIQWLLLIGLALLHAGGPRCCHAGEEPNTTKRATIDRAQADAQGQFVHAVRSPRQAGPTTLRVLPPAKPVAGRRVPVIYLLPVEARDESRYGDPLEEVMRTGLAERHAVIFVAPTFWQLPWYADHPTLGTLAQESYLLEDILPFVERTYPAQVEPAGRLLLGFSKSGWGAWSLLLRHPERFGRAAAWDAPFNLSQPGPFGSAPIFATQQNFDRYDVKQLLARPDQNLGSDPRLMLLGYDAFRADHVAMHARLEQLRVPHVYRDGPRRKHDWHSGWLAEAVEWLLAPRADR